MKINSFGSYSERMLILGFFTLNYSQFVSFHAENVNKSLV